MIKAILFDFDGVLTKDKDDKVHIIDIMKRETGLPEDDILKVINLYFNADLYYGRTSFSDAWNAMCADLKVLKDLMDEYIEQTPIDRRILDLAVRLDKTYKVAILTTNGSGRMKKIREHFGFDEVFKPILVSADIGCTKREPESFRLAIQKLGVEPEEILFIDNSPGNLVQPEKLGIKTFLYTYSDSSCDELVDMMQKLGIDTE